MLQFESTVTSKTPLDKVFIPLYSAKRVIFYTILTHNKVVTASLKQRLLEKYLTVPTRNFQYFKIINYINLFDLKLYKTSINYQFLVPNNQIAVFGVKQSLTVWSWQVLGELIQKAAPTLTSAFIDGCSGSDRRTACGAWTNSGGLSYWRGSRVSLLFCALWTSPSAGLNGLNTHSQSCMKSLGLSEMIWSSSRWNGWEQGEKKKKWLCAACCTLEGTCVLMRCSDLCNPKTQKRKHFVKTALNGPSAEHNQPQPCDTRIHFYWTKPDYV